MEPSFKQFFVLPQERVLKEERIVGAWGLEHVIVSFIVAVILWGGAAVAAFILAPDAFETVATIAAAIFVLHLLLSVIYVWRRIVTTEYVVTAEAVYARRGKLILTVASALLDRVTDLHVHTSLVGRLFGYSGLSVRTAGGGLWMPGLREPYVIRGTIQQARHELITQLLRESGRDQERQAPKPTSQTTPVQCPNCENMFDIALQPRPLDVTCPRCKESGAIFEEAVA